MIVAMCFQLSQQMKLRDAIHADLFPTADMIVSMSREFGVPLTAKGFEGKQSSFDWCFYLDSSSCILIRNTIEI